MADQQTQRRGNWHARAEECREKARVHARAAVNWSEVARDSKDPSLCHMLAESQSEVADVYAKWAREFASRAESMWEVAPAAETMKPATGRSAFCCPKCGGHEWATGNANGPRELWTGHCNNVACGFRWERTRLNDARLGVTSPIGELTESIGVVAK